MTSKFEQLIEYVINDEEAKAKELFHEIVVEKSREIYENLMTEEEEEDLDEAESTDKEDEKAEKAGEKVTKDIEYDDKKDRKERMDEEEDEDMEESMDETMMSDEEEIMDTVDAEEQGMSEGEGEEDLEDRVVDLEDKLDELMAEFESLMGDNGDEAVGDEMDMDNELDIELDSDEGGDALEMDDTEEFKSETMPMEEAVNLKAAPAPVKSEEAGVNKKSTVAANSGAVGAAAKPVNVDTGGEEKGRPAPTAKDMGGTTSPKQGPATKPHLAQATGVNTKTPFPKQ